MVTAAVGWAAAGVVLVVTYHVLAALEVGKIGAPTDIGGGAILLAGYILILVGLIFATVALRTFLHDRRSAS